MRIVFIDLQVNGFYLNTLGDIIARRKAVTKHFYLLDWLLKNDIEVLNLITPAGSTLPAKALIAHTRNLALRKLETKYVFRKNGSLFEGIKNTTHIEDVKEDDIVICYGTFFPSQFETVGKLKGIKIVDHGHFYGDQQSAERIKDKGFQYYTFEVDLSKYSKLYQKNYSWFHGGFIMRPYAFQPRFQNLREFSSRKNKAVAMGTLTKYDNEEFRETYGSVYYQPRRKMIMDHVAELQEELDSYISEYNEKPLKTINETDFVLAKIGKKIINFYSSGKQRHYYSFNMVDVYNQYKMFICPEDVQGSYGIGVMEGMACGCAMVGLTYGAFEDIGMCAGEHYIPYDGSIQDLKAKIQYYQEPQHQKELEIIAKQGCEFVRAHFSQNTVAENYFNTLKDLTCSKN